MDSDALKTGRRAFAQAGAVDGSSRSRRLPSRRGRVLVLAARILLALVIIVCGLLSLTPTGRAAVRAASLLPSLLGTQAPGIFSVADEPARHTQLVLTSQGGDVYLDLYAPIKPPPPIPGAREGLLLIPGVGDNRNVDQLVNLAFSLAHKGVVVAAMTTQTLIDYDLSPRDGNAVVVAFLKVASLPGVAAERVGIVGFSAGGTFACLAAADPRIRDSVSFITLFGGYYDATSMLRDLGRRAQLINGRLVSWKPDPVPLLVLANSIADTLPEKEAALLRGADYYQAVPLSADKVAQLSPPGQAAYHLLIGDEPNAVDANVAALSPGMVRLLRALSPSTVVSSIRTPIYLLHDRHDIYVPFTQSRDFDAALNRIGHTHDYAEFDIFAHVEVRSGLDWGPLVHDGLRLFGILVELIQPAS